jgi:hypothetical protein
LLERRFVTAPARLLPQTSAVIDRRCRRIDKSKVRHRAERLVKKRCGHRVTMDEFGHRLFGFYNALLFAGLP